MRRTAVLTALVVSGLASAQTYPVINFETVDAGGSEADTLIQPLSQVCGILTITGVDGGIDGGSFWFSVCPVDPLSPSVCIIPAVDAGSFSTAVSGASACYNTLDAGSPAVLTKWTVTGANPYFTGVTLSVANTQAVIPGPAGAAGNVTNPIDGGLGVLGNVTLGSFESNPGCFLPGGGDAGLCGGPLQFVDACGAQAARFSTTSCGVPGDNTLIENGFIQADGGFSIANPIGCYALSGGAPYCGNGSNAALIGGSVAVDGGISLANCVFFSDGSKFCSAFDAGGSGGTGGPCDGGGTCTAVTFAPSSCITLASGCTFCPTSPGGGTITPVVGDGGQVTVAGLLTSTSQIQPHGFASYPLLPPSGITVTPTGGASTQYCYYVTAYPCDPTVLPLGCGATSPFDVLTGSTLRVCTTTGPTTLDGSHYNTVTWNPVPGAYGYGVGHYDSQIGLITHLSGNGSTSYVDTGATVDTTAAPLYQDLSSAIVINGFLQDGGYYDAGASAPMSNYIAGRCLNAYAFCEWGGYDPDHVNATNYKTLLNEDPAGQVTAMNGPSPIGDVGFQDQGNGLFLCNPNGTGAHCNWITQPGGVPVAQYFTQAESHIVEEGDGGASYSNDNGPLVGVVGTLDIVGGIGRNPDAGVAFYKTATVADGTAGHALTLQAGATPRVASGAGLKVEVATGNVGALGVNGTDTLDWSSNEVQTFGADLFWDPTGFNAVRVDGSATGTNPQVGVACNDTNCNLYEYGQGTGRPAATQWCGPGATEGTVLGCFTPAANSSSDSTIDAPTGHCVDVTLNAGGTTSAQFCGSVDYITAALQVGTSAAAGTSTDTGTWLGFGTHALDLGSAPTITASSEAACLGTLTSKSIAGGDGAGIASFTTGTTSPCAADTALFTVTLHDSYSSAGYVIMVSDADGTAGILSTSAYYAIPTSSSVFTIHNVSAISPAESTPYKLQFMTMGAGATH